MTITIELPPEQETQLRREAERQGKDVSAYVLELLDRSLPKAPDSGSRDPSEPAEAEGDGGDGREQQETLADLFAGRIGGFKSGGGRALSEHCGERFTDHLEQKRRQGHL